MGDVPWRDELEDAACKWIEQPVPDCLTCLRMFAKQRVDSQRQWYLRKSKVHVHCDWRFVSVIRFTLLAALVLSAGHLAELIWSNGESAGRLVETAAIIIPPIAAAAMALRAICENQGISYSYAAHASELGKLSLALKELEVRAETVRSQTPEADAVALQFKRLVLRTEDALADELRQWWTLMRCRRWVG